MGGECFAATDGVHAFVGFGFEVDLIRRDTEGSGNVCAHCGKVGTEFGAFEDDDGVDVNDAETLLLEEVAREFEKTDGAGIFPAWIGIGEVSADVGEAGGAEECVGDGVNEDVAIGVASGAAVEWDVDAADDEGAAGFEAVEVVAYAGASHKAELEKDEKSRFLVPRPENGIETRNDKSWTRCSSVLPMVGEGDAFLLEIKAGEVEIGGAGDFDVALGTEDNINVAAETFDEGSFVGGLPVIGGGKGKGFAKHSGVENLRGLGEDDALARDGLGDEGDVFGERGAADFFHGVNRGDAEDGGAAGACFGDDAVELLAGDQGADGVVDDDEIGVRGCGGEGVGNGFLARASTVNDADRAAGKGGVVRNAV